MMSNRIPEYSHCNFLCRKCNVPFEAESQSAETFACPECKWEISRTAAVSVAEEHVKYEFERATQEFVGHEVDKMSKDLDDGGGLVSLDLQYTPSVLTPPTPHPHIRVEIVTNSGRVISRM